MIANVRINMILNVRIYMMTNVRIYVTIDVRMYMTTHVRTYMTPNVRILYVWATFLDVSSFRIACSFSNSQGSPNFSKVPFCQVFLGKAKSPNNCMALGRLAPRGLMAHVKSYYNLTRIMFESY